MEPLCDAFCCQGGGRWTSIFTLYDEPTIIRIVVIGLIIYLFAVMERQPLKMCFVCVPLQEVGAMAFSAFDEVN